MKRLQGAALGATLLIFTAAWLGAVLGRPLFFASVISNSMLPLMERGDVVLTLPTVLREPQVGDIVVFRPSTSTWIVHRLVAGDATGGFLTRGDANDYTDQNRNGYPPITRTMISAFVPTVAGRALKVPQVGYASTWLQSFTGQPAMLAGLTGAAALLLFLSPGSHPRRRRAPLRPRPHSTLVLWLGVLVGAGVLLATLSKQSTQSLEYQVVEQARPSVGARVPEVSLHSRTSWTATFTNDAPIPLVGSIASTLPDTQADHDWMLLWPGQREVVTMTLTATALGRSQGELRLATFLPVLPPALLHAVAARSFWLAMALTCLAAIAPFLLLYAWDRHDAPLRARPRRLTRRELGTLAAVGHEPSRRRSAWAHLRSS